MLKNEDSFIRYQALEALSNTKDLTLLPAILKHFKDKDNFSYPAMNDAFCRFGQKISDELAQLIKSKNTPLHIKVPALMALAQIGDVKNIVESATIVSTDKNDDFRAFAFRSLAKSRQEIPLEILQRGYRDYYWRVRLYTAQSAVNIIPLPARILKTLLDDENSIVGFQAANALFSAGEVGQRFLNLIAENYSSRAGKRAKMILLEKGGDKFK